MARNTMEYSSYLHSISTDACACVREILTNAPEIFCDFNGMNNTCANSVKAEWRHFGWVIISNMVGMQVFRLPPRLSICLHFYAKEFRNYRIGKCWNRYLTLLMSLREFYFNRPKIPRALCFTFGIWASVMQVRKYSSKHLMMCHKLILTIFI